VKRLFVNCFQVDTRVGAASRVRDYQVYQQVSARTPTVHPLRRHLVLCQNTKGRCDAFDLRGKTKQAQAVLSLEGHTRALSSAVFSPLTGAQNDERRKRTRRASNRSVAFSGDRVVTVCYDNKVRLYDTRVPEGRLFPERSIAHNNQTGRWLTTFKVRSPDATLARRRR